MVTLMNNNTLETFILIGGLVLLAAVFASKAMYKYGVPTLIIFLLMGMLVGNTTFGLDFLNFSSKPGLSNNIASFALLVIIFTGGFETKWKKAKDNAHISIILASLGVVLTAVFVGLFTKLILDFSWLESMLVGAIISSTDAAAVFSILRAKKLNLKNNIGPLLEMESGSNDPTAYMITIILVGMILGTSQNILLTFILQVLSGLGIGALIGFFSIKVINKINLEIDGLYIIIALGMMLTSFGLADLLGGNGYLAVYVTGLILGNNNIVYKPSLMQFYDGLSWLAQILLFFTLGLFVAPEALFSLSVLVPGLLIALFISFVARPLAVIPLMSLFKKPLRDSIFVSWVGFRGAASIVFAISAFAMADIAGNLPFQLVTTKIFNIVFIVAIVSVLLQGTLLVPLAKKLDLVEPEGTILKTFTDYSGSIFTELLEVNINGDHESVGRKIKDLNIPEAILIVLIQRDDKMIPPKGHIKILEGDVLLLAGETRQDLINADKAIREIRQDLE